MGKKKTSQKSGKGKLLATERTGGQSSSLVGGRYGEESEGDGGRMDVVKDQRGLAGKAKLEKEKNAASR